MAAPDHSEIRLTLPARPENIAVVRHVLGAFADVLGLPEVVRENMRLAVTEACTNVVRHAYSGDRGTIDVVVRPDGDVLEVTVSDAGRGVGPSPDTTGPGLGLPLITALADEVEFERDRHRGSSLMMRFTRGRTPHAIGLA
jgi:serine/threonine-protein kinase RsbW